jgi:hypothetical protein
VPFTPRLITGASRYAAFVIPKAKSACARKRRHVWRTITGTNAKAIQRNVGSDSPATAGATATRSMSAPNEAAPRRSESRIEFVASARRRRGSLAARFALASWTPSVDMLPTSHAIAVRKATWPRPSAPSARAMTRTFASDRKAAATFVP